MKQLFVRMMRGLKSTAGQFISIVLVISVGSALFAGMFGTINGMDNAVNDYYSSQNLADAWVYYKGISRDDIDGLFSSEGNIVAEGRYVYDAHLLVNNAESELLVRSMTDINRSIVSDGEAPVALNEIMVDNKYASENKLSVGARLEFLTDDGPREMIVTGFCYNPEAAYVQKDAFSSVSHRAFGVAYATKDTLIALNKTTTTYLDVVDESKQKIDDAQAQLNEADGKLADAESQLNDAKTEADESLGRARQKLDDVASKISEGQAQIDSQTQLAQNEIDTKRAELDATKIQLDEAREQLNASRTEWEAKYKDYESGQEELNKQRVLAEEQSRGKQEELVVAKNQLDNAKTQYDTAYSEYLAIRDTLPEEQQQTMNAEFETQSALLQTQEQEYFAALESLNTEQTKIFAPLDEQQVKLDDAELELEDAKNQLDGLAADLDLKMLEYQTAAELLEQKQSELNGMAALKQSELDAARSSYNSALDEFGGKKREVQDELSQKERELSDAKVELSDSKLEFKDQKADAEKMLDEGIENFQEVLIRANDPTRAIELAENNDSYVTAVTRDEHSSVKTVDQSLDPLRVLALLFPMIFFLVAAAIAFISISRTVEAERTQIAIMRALGTPKAKIYFSYLSYAFMASLFGSIAFALLGNILLPGGLVQVFTTSLDLPAMQIAIQLQLIILPLLIAVAFTGLAALSAVTKVVKEKPAQGMRPRPPKSSGHTLLEKNKLIWNAFSSSGRLMARNILRNKKRILLSAVGIIGSVTLLVTGLSLNRSASTVMESTLDGMGYDILINYNELPSEKLDLGIVADVDSV